MDGALLVIAWMNGRYVMPEVGAYGQLLRGGNEERCCAGYDSRDGLNGGVKGYL